MGTILGEIVFPFRNLKIAVSQTLCENELIIMPLHKNDVPLRISSINVTKSVGNVGFVTFTEEILNGKFHFLCSDGYFYFN